MDLSEPSPYQTFTCRSAPSNFKFAFNQRNDLVDLTLLSIVPKSPFLNFSRLRKSSIELKDKRFLNELAPKGVVACIASVSLSTASKPSELDIRKENFDLLLESFGLVQCTSFAHSAAMTFDIYHEKDTSKLLHSSIFLQQFFGVYMSYDCASNLLLGLCWGGDRILPLFLNALDYLNTLKYHPFSLLLAANMAFNAYFNWRLNVIDTFVAKVTKRTGHQGWDMTAYDVAKGTFSDLSAQMSGTATMLAANVHLSTLAQMTLKQIRAKARLDGFPNTEVAGARVDAIDELVEEITSRLVLQDVEIKMLTTMAQQQLTAVRSSETPFNLYSDVLTSGDSCFT